jgi:hypothetical protein
MAVPQATASTTPANHTAQPHSPTTQPNHTDQSHSGGCPGGRERGRRYPHPPGLPIRRTCGKVHRDLSDAIGPIAATYASLAGCSVRNFYLSIYLYYWRFALIAFYRVDIELEPYKPNENRTNEIQRFTELAAAKSVRSFSQICEDTKHEHPTTRRLPREVCYNYIQPIAKYTIQGKIKQHPNYSRN